jgi:hypothetical protein
MNHIGPDGAAAISSGLASVPQLTSLEYVCVCGVRLCVPGCDSGVGAWDPCGLVLPGACWGRLWCFFRLAMNCIGPDGAAAISGGLASVPLLQTLKYVCACVRCVQGSVGGANPPPPRTLPPPPPRGPHASQGRLGVCEWSRWATAVAETVRLWFVCVRRVCAPRDACAGAECACAAWWETTSATRARRPSVAVWPA